MNPEIAHKRWKAPAIHSTLSIRQTLGNGAFGGDGGSERGTEGPGEPSA